MATKENVKVQTEKPKKLSKMGEYLRSGKVMFPGVECDMRAVLK